MSAFIRGEGGWGGERGPSGPTNVVPDRTPDHSVSSVTRPEQALIYRLSGDRNPLHSDPSFAQLAGFDRPILHGLCTYGFAGRALLHRLCDGDPARFGSIEGRFSSPVFPGEELTTEIWRPGDGQAVFRVLASGDRVVFDAGGCTFRRLNLPGTSPTTNGRTGSGWGCARSTRPTGSRSTTARDATSPRSAACWRRVPTRCWRWSRMPTARSGRPARSSSTRWCRTWPRVGRRWTRRFAAGLHPIDAAGRLTQEDWCVHLPDAEGAWRLVAASVCFPTRWDLTTKIGRTIRQIHAPVPLYEQQLADPMDAYFARMRPGPGVWRLNWNLLDDPTLHQPTHARPAAPPDASSSGCSRSGCASSVRRWSSCPTSGAIVFGIRIHQDPLASIAGDAGAVARLRGALEQLPPEVLRDKGLVELGSGDPGVAGAPPAGEAAAQRRAAASEQRQVGLARAAQHVVVDLDPADAA